MHKFVLVLGRTCENSDPIVFEVSEVAGLVRLPHLFGGTSLIGRNSHCNGYTNVH